MDGIKYIVMEYLHTDMYWKTLCNEYFSAMNTLVQWIL